LQRVKLKATLHLSKKTATGIEIPGEIVEELEGGKKPVRAEY